MVDQDFQMLGPTFKDPVAWVHLIVNKNAVGEVIGWMPDLRVKKVNLSWGLDPGWHKKKGPDLVFMLWEPYGNRVLPWGGIP